MKPPRLSLASLLLLGVATLAPAQEGVLSLPEALRSALAHNRQVENATLAVGIADDRLGQARASRYPQLRVSALGGYLLSPLEFHFRRGVFGEYSGVGPVPAEDTVIEAPQELAFSGVAQLTQPLSQQYEIGLRVQTAKVGREAGAEKLRAQHLNTMLQVRQAYYALVQVEAAIQAGAEALRFAREFERIIAESLGQKAALRSDLLEARARVVEAEVAYLQWRDAQVSQKEQLNLLLGRPLWTEFSVEPVAPPDAAEEDLDKARATALAQRPEFRLARLGVRQAELDLKVTRAAYIPEVSLALSHIRTTHHDVLPAEISTVGLQVQWDLFEGGRRKHEVAAASKTLQQARNTLTDAEAQVLIDVGTKQRKLQRARLALTAAELQREAEQEKLRVVMNTFRENLALRRDVLQQSAATGTAVSRHQQALQAFWSARAEFEAALGLE